MKVVAEGVVALLLVGPLAFGACGAEVVLPGEEDRCREGGGTWTETDCGAANNWCDLGACEHVVGPGCVCPEGACWDGSTCVPSPPPPPARCYATCDAPPPFACVPDCNSTSSVAPACIAGAWVCPPEQGRFPSSLCSASKAQGECGGLKDEPCPAGSFCSYGLEDDGTCGRSGMMGSCVEEGAGCKYYKEEVCSCGGWVNSNPGCGPDEKPFQPGATYATCSEPIATEVRCGMWMSCSETRYCVRRPTSLPGVFHYACEPVGFDSEDDPKTASCAGLTEHPCGEDCAEEGGMVILTCSCDSAE